MNLLKSTGFLIKSLCLRHFCFLNIRGDFRIFSNLLVSFHTFTGIVGKNQEFTNGLSAGYPQEFLLRIIEMNMRVSVQRHADIAVTHDILQRLRGCGPPDGGYSVVKVQPKEAFTYSEVKRGKSQPWMKENFPFTYLPHAFVPKSKHPR